MTGFSTDTCIFHDRMTRPVPREECGTCHIPVTDQPSAPLFFPSALCAADDLHNLKAGPERQPDAHAHARS